MSKQTVFLVGATGETGGSILNALIEDGSFDITCFIRTSSASKPSTQKLKDLGLKVIFGSLSDPVSKLATLLQGIDTVISVIFPLNINEQIPLVDAAVLAGVKRFVPCNFTTPSPRGGIFSLRDAKEDVHDHIFRAKLGYTIIDVGYWYQSSFPRVPSGKFDYAAFMPINDLYNGGTAKNMITDKVDVGTVTVMCIKDERTLNKRVYTYGEVLSQNEINAIVEKKTGEKLELTSISAAQILENIGSSAAAAAAEPDNLAHKYRMVVSEYANTKYVRSDNTPEMAEYLGYISARELWPEFVYKSFGAFVDELVEGRGERIYPLVQT